MTIIIDNRLSKKEFEDTMEGKMEEIQEATLRVGDVINDLLDPVRKTAPDFIGGLRDPTVWKIRITGTSYQESHYRRIPGGLQFRKVVVKFDDDNETTFQDVYKEIMKKTKYKYHSRGIR